MKIALGMIVGNDQKALSKYLPVVAPCFENRIAVDSYSRDGTIDVLVENNFDVVERHWDYDYSEARNTVIRRAEETGMEALVMLDADECMFPNEIQVLKRLLEQYEAIKLPRYEFGPTSEFYNPTLYPDYQGRAFHLNKDYCYRNKLHESLYRKGVEEVPGRDIFHASDTTHIFHYGRCKPVEEIWLKYNNYNLILKGENPIDKIPEGMKFDISNNFTNVKKFEGNQPI